ncbi:hypothetical protein GCM10012287_05180 [Streptomyces daqingensis]|uniref:Nucleotidyltransferase domain-containing protein n=1 Tax=Streptomyces daqingensis TaxID=1472640 RepID=A0ABQ2LTW9_9ACTN|nr:hypothetical protein [Streptomyces daqingensis]GGO43022.1 hypothetical protein GCM10012287_05180 [Streptomyces daqingensis]
MRVGEARAAAADWVARYGRSVPGYRGAYFSGSTVGLPGDAELPATSDVDVVVVTDTPRPPAAPGKFGYRGAVLEVSHMPASQLERPEQVLGSYHLAGSFRTCTVIEDPGGLLRGLQTEVPARFADLPWVRRRCEDARHRIVSRLEALRAREVAAPFHEQVMAWLFPTGVTTHVPLVAALRNPTVRLRYLRVREALDDYGLPDIYPELLELLGCREWSAARVRHHLRALAAARPIAVDGSRELIGRGDHREAVFWIIATFTRCHTVLAADAPELHRSLDPAFREAVADLGIGSVADLLPRAERVLRFLPRLWDSAEDIMARNTAIAR